MNAQADVMFDANSAALEARGLMKYFGEQCVLNQINLSIPSGSVVGLIGCNGAGKSTLIRCLLGLMTHDAGDCMVFGENSLRLSDNNKARIGYVPQQPDALGWLNVRQMLDFVSGFYPRWDHAFVAASIARWNINASTLLSKLSPGERQRIAVLRAMAYHPELLVLDEPAAALDPVARRELLRDIATRAADCGTTVLFSTHIVSDLERVASDIVFVHEKNLLLQMSMDDIKEHTLCLRLSPESASHLSGKVPGEISRRRHQNSGISIVIKREQNQEWPAICHAPGIRRENLSLEDLFIEVAQ